MYAGNLQAARVHSEPKQKLSVFKFRTEWLVVDIPAGLVIHRTHTWTEALEAAQIILNTALIREACS